MSADFVEATIPVRLVVEFGPATEFEVTLGYDSADPLAVTAVFQSDGCETSWILARGLLAIGCEHRTGQGDIRVWPAEAEGRRLLAMSLTSPDGEACIEMDRAAVEGFLAATQVLVPYGAEIVDVDAMLAGLGVTA